MQNEPPARQMLLRHLIVFGPLAVSLFGQDNFADFTFNGIVPSGAVYGVLQVLRNCGGCAGGPIDVVLSNISYSESGGPNLVPDPNFQHGCQGCGSDARAVVTARYNWPKLRLRERAEALRPLPRDHARLGDAHG